MSDEAAISVDGTAIVTYTITAGKKGISFQNVGSKVAWYGGSTTVAPASNRGNKLFPNQSLIFKNVNHNFALGFRCATGESTTIAVIHYD